MLVEMASTTAAITIDRGCRSTSKGSTRNGNRYQDFANRNLKENSICVEVTTVNADQANCSSTTSSSGCNCILSRYLLNRIAIAATVDNNISGSSGTSTANVEKSTSPDHGMVASNTYKRTAGCLQSKTTASAQAGSNATAGW